MVDTNGLMRGNELMHDEDIVIVESILGKTSVMFQFYESDSFSMMVEAQSLSPIPITKEWLDERFMFNQTEHRYEIGDIKIRISGKEEFSLFWCYTLVGKVKFVHEV